MKKAIITITIMTIVFLCALWWLFDMQLAIAVNDYKVMDENNQPINAKVYKYNTDKGRTYIICFPKLPHALLFNNGKQFIQELQEDDLYYLPLGFVVRMDKSSPLYVFNESDFDGTLIVYDFYLSDNLMWCNTFLWFTSYGKKIIVKKMETLN